MRNIILKSGLALGDITCFTAVPRELARQYPGQFQVAVETPFPDLWEHNPHVVGSVDPRDWERWGEWETIDCHYDRDPWFSVHRSNQHPVHMLHAYCQHVANALGLPSLHPGELRGDIHLSGQERGWKSIPHERHNVQRYWIICAGGKMDFPTKWWGHELYQRVVDYFRGRVQFVQVGGVGPGHVHQPLTGVVDLIGQTDTRQLVRLIHSSCGMLCGITSLMHLAAAVPTPAWQTRNRPCVVVAGGREPRTWYGYPTHRIMETVGTLACCARGGCWQSHVVPLSDGKDEGRRFCERVVNGRPKCLEMIRPEAVILAMESYLDGEGVE